MSGINASRDHCARIDISFAETAQTILQTVARPEVAGQSALKPVSIWEIALASCLSGIRPVAVRIVALVVLVSFKCSERAAARAFSISRHAVTQPYRQGQRKVSCFQLTGAACVCTNACKQLQL